MEPDLSVHSAEISSSKASVECGIDETSMTVDEMKMLQLIADDSQQRNSHDDDFISPPDNGPVLKMNGADEGTRQHLQRSPSNSSGIGEGEKFLKQSSCQTDDELWMQFVTEFSKSKGNFIISI